MRVSFRAGIWRMLAMAPGDPVGRDPILCPWLPNTIKLMICLPAAYEYQFTSAAVTKLKILAAY